MATSLNSSTMHQQDLLQTTYCNSMYGYLAQRNVLQAALFSGREFNCQLVCANIHWRTGWSQESGQQPNSTVYKVMHQGRVTKRAGSAAKPAPKALARSREWKVTHHRASTVNPREGYLTKRPCTFRFRICSSSNHQLWC